MKKFQSIICLCLALILLGGNSIICRAEENMTAFVDVSAKKTELYDSNVNSYSTSTASLGGCEIGVGIYSNGIGIEFTTRSTVEAEEIGVRDLILYERTLLGWTEIPIKDYCDYDTNFFSKAIVYVRAIEGKTYKASCTHYAIIDGVEYTLENETSEIVYN